MIEVGEKRYLIMVIISFVIYGCVDNNYDLKKDISLDVEIGGDAFVFPIGTTEKLLLKEIMDISDPLEIDNDSNYYIKKNGDIEDFEIEIDPFEIDMDDPEFDSRTVSIDRYYDSDLDYIFRFDEDRFGYLPISEQDKIKQQLELDKEDAKKCEVNLSGEFNFVETINLSQTDLPKDVLSLVSIKPEIGADRKSVV